MIITLGKWIYVEAMRFSGEEPAAVMEIEGDPHIRPNGPIHYDFSAQWAEGKLIVRGGLAAPVSMRCSRCGVWFERRIEVKDFFRVVEAGTEGGVVDLTCDIREDILLAFPFVALCSETCKGVCHQCGANRNLASCGCKPIEHAAWGAFDVVSLSGVITGAQENKTNGCSKKKSVEKQAAV